MDNELNVRSDAGTNNTVVGVLKKGEVYTIVDEKDVRSAQIVFKQEKRLDLIEIHGEIEVII